MEPKFEGFCTGCNSYSDDLKVCIAKNNNSGITGVGKFCPECRERFRLKSIFESGLAVSDRNDEK